LAADASNELSIAVVEEAANVNEKKVASKVFHKTSRKRRRWRNVVADTQHSSQAFREEVKRVGAEAVTSYPKNQMKTEQVLRVDRKLRSQKPSRLKQLY